MKLFGTQFVNERCKIHIQKKKKKRKKERIVNAAPLGHSKVSQNNENTQIF